ncbi:TIM-barrel domain-containing protein [Puniceibacterium sediminis]|uniref:Alpha-glucosidase n=1 Tax=Puniceibacterium sediminis TaxID=1608407 RepID=A0A238YC13_9RHOB|nr:TIM-barrel domain-containing protein [Puniceibacterium sediminis]SNR68512.1 alpha-glucosidase [Puniceibacterium sediminis]
MKTLKTWALDGQDATGVTLTLGTRGQLRIAVLEDALFRVSLVRDAGWRQGRTWSIAPDGDTPWEGRSRDSVEGFSCPGFTLDQGESTLTIATGAVRLTVSTPLCLTWQAFHDGAWVTFAQERPTSAYMAGIRDYRHSHFLLRRPGERFYGLGEKTGELERSGRRYEMRNLDAMGYDAETTDPLYKHLPVTLTKTPDAGSYSLFYDNLATCWFDLGNELDNYHLPFRAYRAEDGDLDYYLRWSPDLLGLVKGQARLTGGTAFPPRWALGYSGSTMSYTDEPDAQVRLNTFLDRLAEYRIPCDSFQMSSGYTSIGAKRYVFNWNTAKFPDIDSMTASFADAGVNLVANIKPCLLKDHPRYDEVAEAGLFITDSEDATPEISTFWDAEGSHLDFTNRATVDWWKSNVTTALLDHGIASTWNDNNEYEVWDDTAICAGFGKSIDVSLIRPLHSVLMTRASEEAQIEHAPDVRPYLISRAGAPGIQRYAQTWTGDNRTAWKTIRYNTYMGLGLSMSGIFNVGHDVGGFSGPKPGPELFLRWIQNGIFHPRFTIHSWNDNATANEAWMYPEILPQVRDALALRYALVPYLYTLLYRAVTADEPMLRPTFLDHEQDARCFEQSDDFMLGRDLLVASVMDEGATERRIWLPANVTGWWDYHAGTWHEGGQEITLPVDLGSIPLFVRGGAVIPLAEGAARADAASGARVLAVFPAMGAQDGTSLLYEDDGQAADALDGNHCLIMARLSGDQALKLELSMTGAYTPGFDSVKVVLPRGEKRILSANGISVATGDIVTLGAT